ncbi:protein kinase domain-containing protein [Mycobacterium scrofulaceum]|uniref:non-specific serine/threonine protein kinase n=1 Tax=Mycobacterium scrofulaceum TaxID=1783 RepID=A0A1A2W5V6_MYCSC|nr:protein kinase [Mycobacterium scrofulaceum]OBI08600.1 protein kinase [Mycobacterium scrofulaceum]
MGSESFGHYQLLDVLGRGGMGEVYRAYDAATDRVVALKVLPPNMAEDQEFQQRFRREARIAASLNDPHVVPIHSYGEIDGRLYVDMRLIEGRDLLQYIAENGGRLSPERAVAVIEQVAAALDSAHHAGLVHRDIKPKNILVTNARDFVYLIDFGIARTLADTSLTQTGHTMGTVAYMAPERFRGSTDHRADVYSLACVLHECLTGKRPYVGESLEEQLNAHLNTPPPRPSATVAGVSPALDAVVARGMAKDVEQRYQSAIELAEAARAALAAPAGTAAWNPPAAPATPPPPSAGPPTQDFPPTGPSPEPQPSYRAPTHSRRLLFGIVGASTLALAAVVALVIALVTQNDGSANGAASTSASRARVPNRQGATSGPTGQAMATVPPLPAFAPPADLGANCQYPSAPDTVVKPVSPPPSGRVSTEPAEIPATISTNFGDIGIQLANSESPCTVNSFVSLAKQQFFDNTQCARLINSTDGGSLLCGGPEADGSGGPGYQFADEYPTDQYPAGDPGLRATVLYPRGTVIMAVDGPNTNGSQFSFVFRDSELQPTSTVLGTISQAGLAVLDKIAEAGIAGNRQSGAPTNPVTINSVRIG